MGAHIVLAGIQFLVSLGLYLPVAMGATLMLKGWLLITIPAIFAGCYVILILLSIARGHYTDGESAWVLDDSATARLTLRDPFFERVAALAGLVANGALLEGMLLWGVPNIHVTTAADFQATIGASYVAQPYAALMTAAALLYLVPSLVMLLAWYSNALYRRTKNLLNLVVINSTLEGEQQSDTLADIVRRTKMETYP